MEMGMSCFARHIICLQNRSAKLSLHTCVYRNQKTFWPEKSARIYVCIQDS
ncbi:hypothetical protein Hanom_Chr15g01358701 [Helianthus anomalus]